MWEPRPRGDEWWSARLIATGASLLQEDACILWEPRPRGDGSWSAKLDRDEGVAPTGGLPAFCGSPALGAMGGGLRSLIATGASLLQGDACILWVPRSRSDGSWSARLFATRASLLQEAACILWEPRPRGDEWWSARLFATRASLPQKSWKPTSSGRINSLAHSGPRFAG